MTAIFYRAAVLLTLMTTAASAQQGLSGADIQKLLKNKRVSLSCIDGTSGAGKYTMARNFGLIKGNYTKAGAKPVSDTGIVRAQGNNLCVRFEVLNAGNENCFDVLQTGRGQFQFSFSGVKACTLSAL